MKSNRINEQIEISLTNQEAIVLYEWLNRFNDNDDNHFIEDQSEERVLFDIESILEKVLHETFNKNYEEILKDARDFLRDTE